MLYPEWIYDDHISYNAVDIQIKITNTPIDRVWGSTQPHEDNWVAT
jgi:hypothetical protein